MTHVYDLEAEVLAEIERLEREEPPRDLANRPAPEDEQRAPRPQGGPDPGADRLPAPQPVLARHGPRRDPPAAKGNCTCDTCVPPRATSWRRSTAGDRGRRLPPPRPGRRSRGRPAHPQSQGRQAGRNRERPGGPPALTTTSAAPPGPPVPHRPAISHLDLADGQPRRADHSGYP